MRRKLVLVGGLLAVFVGLALVGLKVMEPKVIGTGAQVGASTTTTVDYQGYLDEYRRSLSSLQWPQGAAPDQVPPNGDKSGQYEVGAGEGDAVQVWQCSWMGEYLAKRQSDPTGAAAALGEYAKIVTLPAWNRSLRDPNTQAVIRESIAKARLGDGSLIESLHRANC